MSVGSPPPSDMVVSVVRVLPLAAALAIAAAHPRSHDNIVRVQLWDAEGLSREPLPAPSVRPSQVDARIFFSELGHEFWNRGGHHRVRHKRRRARRSENVPEWRFHSGSRSVNVVSYEEGEEPPPVIKDAGSPERLSDPADEDDTEKKVPAVVPKCCPSGKNLSADIGGKRECQPSALTFQPLFYDSNDTHMWSYDSNLFETIVGNPCPYDRYRLEPEKNSEDEFYLLINGSLFVPYQRPTLLGTKEFCMETFWSPENPAGLTLPVLCFTTPASYEQTTSATLIVYAVGLIISVPFLLATICVYTFIIELRTTYGKSLACHCACLAMAFSCLAATQLGGHAFPGPVCTIMACLIQFSFVSCFFWLNVMCFDTLWNVQMELKLMFSTDRAEMRRRFMWYCLYAFVLPLILLIITVAMEFSPAVPSTYLKPNFGVVACWFKSDEAALPFFYGPVALSLIVNMFLFVFTSRGINRLRNDPESLAVPMMTSNLQNNITQPTSTSNYAIFSQHSNTTGNINERLRRHRKKFRMSLYLCTLMSISWIMEVVSWAAGAETGPSVWSIFDMLNALQGLFIFVIYVLQKSVRTQVKIKWCMRSRPENTGLLRVVSEPSIFENGRRDDV